MVSEIANASERFLTIADRGPTDIVVSKCEYHPSRTNVRHHEPRAPRPVWLIVCCNAGADAEEGLDVRL